MGTEGIGDRDGICPLVPLRLQADVGEVEQDTLLGEDESKEVHVIDGNGQLSGKFKVQNLTNFKPSLLWEEFQKRGSVILQT